MGVHFGDAIYELVPIDPVTVPIHAFLALPDCETRYRTVDRTRGIQALVTVTAHPDETVGALARGSTATGPGAGYGDTVPVRGQAGA